jgi:hypothetical protein
MRKFTPDGIKFRSFTSGRRKGYHTLEVDVYLEHLAEYVGWMQAELARSQETERTSLDVLIKAQRVADETATTAQRNAEQVVREAAEGVELARAEARQMLDDARVEADKIVLSAQVRAESWVQSSLSGIAELEAAGVERSKELERDAEELQNSVAESAAELRFAGLRLLEVAERYDFELPACDEAIDLDADIASVVAEIAEPEKASNEGEGWLQSPVEEEGPSDDEFRFSLENEGQSRTKRQAHA